VNFWKRHVATKYRNRGNEALALVIHHPKYSPRRRSRPRPMKKGGNPGGNLRAIATTVANKATKLRNVMRENVIQAPETVSRITGNVLTVT
jgi:hypothetical protein